MSNKNWPLRYHFGSSSVNDQIVMSLIKSFCWKLLAIHRTRPRLEFSFEHWGYRTCWEGICVIARLEPKRSLLHQEYFYAIRPLLFLFFSKDTKCVRSYTTSFFNLLFSFSMPRNLQHSRITKNPHRALVMVISYARFSRKETFFTWLNFHYSRNDEIFNLSRILFNRNSI